MYLAQETFTSLLHDRAHWEFELFLMFIFDLVLGGLLWPFLRRHWNHHLDRDRREGNDKGHLWLAIKYYTYRIATFVTLYWRP